MFRILQYTTIRHYSEMKTLGNYSVKATALNRCIAQRSHYVVTVSIYNLVITQATLVLASALISSHNLLLVKILSVLERGAGEYLSGVNLNQPAA